MLVLVNVGNEVFAYGNACTAAELVVNGSPWHVLILFELRQSFEQTSFVFVFTQQSNGLEQAL